MTTQITLSGLESLDELASSIGATRERIGKSLVRAVNRATEKGRTRAQRQAEAEVAFPSGYLNPNAGRLTVSRRATSAKNPEAAILGRRRPTSLARFVTGGTRGEAGVLVQVSPGKTQRLENAFLVKLKSGKAETKNNMGLAVRLPKGQKPRNTTKAVEMAPGLFLLYGPSINQILGTMVDGTANRTALGPTILRDLENEFLRQVRL